MKNIDTSIFKNLISLILTLYSDSECYIQPRKMKFLLKFFLCCSKIILDKVRLKDIRAVYIKRIINNLISTKYLVLIFQNRSSPLKQDYTRKRQGQRVRKMVSRARVCFEDFLPISRTMGTKFFWSRFLTTAILSVSLFSSHSSNSFLPWIVSAETIDGNTVSIFFYKKQNKTAIQKYIREVLA